MSFESTTPERPPSTGIDAWPPGWYPVNPTTFGWWDGRMWTGHFQPITSQQTAEEAGAFSASFAWWGSLLVGLWPALIIFLTNSPTSQSTNRFARFSAGEALNVHLTVMCASIPLYGLFMGSFLLSFARASDDAQFTGFAFPAGFLIVWLIAIVGGTALTVVYILAAVRAHNGVWWRATYAIPFLRAHRLLAPTH